MLRILHFSDVHVTAPLDEVPRQQLLNKRVLGLANLRWHRGPMFADAAAKLGLLARFAQRQAVDLAICTGDYTALGTVPELRAARQAIEPFTEVPLGLFTVPGNHDLYMPDALVDGRFENFFGEFLRSDAPDLCTDGLWPIVKLPNPSLAVVLVNSSRPNPELWRSSGRISDAQLGGLRQALADERLKNRFVIIATHYAPRLASGRPDSVFHGLKNADAFLAACTQARRGMVIFGHVHRRYCVRLPDCPLPLFGAGSATHGRRESFWWYELEDDRRRAIPGRWDGSDYVLDRANAVDI